MAEVDTPNVTGHTIEPLGELLLHDIEIQISLIILVAGILSIFLVSRKISYFIDKKKFRYTRPYATEIVKKIILPLFVLVLVTSVTAYIQFFELFDTQAEIDAANAGEELTPREMFVKILDTVIILVVGYTIAHLIPIHLANNEARKLEKLDFQEWIHMRGFSNDKEDLFHQLYEWAPPKHGPSDMTEEEYQDKLKNAEGIKSLENYYTSKGTPIGSFKQMKSNAFKRWKKSEREKYDKYFDDCVSGNNEVGQELRPGVFPHEIYTISIWRDQKRNSGYEPIIPGARPPGWAARQGQDTQKSIKQMIPILIFVGVLIGIAAWWEIDLVVVATASGGLAVGLGFALQETMQNYFAYVTIKKDKIFVEGDRVKLENGYIGIVSLITPRVTIVRHALNESVAIIATKQLLAATVVNYSKDNTFVPATVEVGASYLNDPEEIASVLVKVGQMAMKRIKDVRGRHMIVQERCPYRDARMKSCGCDKNIMVDLDQPRVRLTNFNSSSIDFTLWVFVRDYGSQFKVKSDMRIMIIKEFKKHNIGIPFPIKTEYRGNLDQELKDLKETDSIRKKTLEKYGTGDLNYSEKSQSSEISEDDL